MSTMHLHGKEVTGNDTRMIRGEQQKRLYGAVTAAERKSRQGLYYTANWKVSEESGNAPVRLKFTYLQAATASKQLTKAKEYSAGVVEGVCEFEVTGDSYAKNGRVLAWKMELYAGDRLVDSQQSYMWQ